MPWWWWAFGLLGTSCMWRLTFHDRVVHRRPLALALALIYTLGLLLALGVTLVRS